MPVTLKDVPEEILERILALVLVQSAEPSPRPAWHLYQTPPPSGHPTVISPLLVCRAWLRIATPIHYRHPVLRSARHAELFLRALRDAPALAPCVRSLHLHATSPALREIMPLCTGVDTLDVTVDNADGQQLAMGAAAGGRVAAGEGARDRAVMDFCEGLTRTRYIRHLVIRKNAYLTQPNAIYIFEQLANAVTRWHRLETVKVAFRLSPSPAASALTKALAVAPRLHTVYTQLPAVWNTTLLDIAQNPALARIVLSPSPELASAHLFLAEAKRYPRLLDLFRAGNPPPPPTPHPLRAGPSVVVTGNARARAASAIITGNPPMPVPTWGYERDVPPPGCSPTRRPLPYGHGAPATMVGPSAYAYAPLQPAPSSAHYPGPQPAMQYVVPQQYLHVNYPGQHQHQHHASQYHPGVGVPVRGPTSPAVPAQSHHVGGQLPKRTGPGNRRMTAS